MEWTLAIWIVGLSRAGASFLASRKAGDPSVSIGMVVGIPFIIMRSVDLAASITERGRGGGERDNDKDEAEGEAEKHKGGNGRVRRLRRQLEFHAYSEINASAFL